MRVEWLLDPDAHDHPDVPLHQPVRRRIENLDLRAGPEEPIDLVERLFGDPRLARHDGESECRSLPRVLTTDLGRRDSESLTGTVEQRPDDLPAILQRLRFRNPDLHFERDSVHREEGIRSAPDADRLAPRPAVEPSVG